MAMDRIAALSTIDVAYGMQLKYLRYNLWSDEKSSFRYSPMPPCLAVWMEHARPLPGVPKSEFKNIKAVNTIRNNPLTCSKSSHPSMWTILRTYSSLTLTIPSLSPCATACKRVSGSGTCNIRPTHALVMP